MDTWPEYLRLRSKLMLQRLRHSCRCLCAANLRYTKRSIDTEAMQMFPDQACLYNKLAC